MKAVKAIYNFLVGDFVILTGTIIALILLVILNNISIFLPVRELSGLLLVVAVLVVLVLSLVREIRPKS